MHVIAFQANPLQGPAPVAGSGLKLREGKAVGGGVAEVGSGHRGPGECRALQRGAGQGGIAEIGAGEVGLAEVGAGEVLAVEVPIRQVIGLQADPRQAIVRVAEGALKLCERKAIDRGTAKVRFGHRGPGKRGVRQLGGVEVGAGEVLSGEVPAGTGSRARQVIRFQADPLQVLVLVAGGALKFASVNPLAVVLPKSAPATVALVNVAFASLAELKLAPVRSCPVKFQPEPAVGPDRSLASRPIPCKLNAW